MVAAISSWAKTITIAVIIGTIIEMILPDNKNKKYIKVVIGIYILFCIINPVVGKNIDFNEYNIEKYINASTSNNVENSSISVDEVYNEKMISNIRVKLKSQGYDSDNINITSDKSYNIKSITISNIYEYKKENEISVNKVEIDIKDKNTKGIANSQKTQLIKLLSENYGVDKENIIID